MTSINKMGFSRFISFAFLAGLLLIAGCTSPTKPKTETLTCYDYCTSLPAPACTGSWSISGNYPDCACKFECEKSSDNQTQKVSPPAPVVNVTVNESSKTNVTVAPPPPPPQPKKPISQTFNDTIKQIRTDFYVENPGSYTEFDYRWDATVNDSFGSKDIKLGQFQAVKFNGAYIPSLQTFEFYEFKSATNPNKIGIYGLALMNDTSSSLDNYGTFSTTYLPELQNLDGCVVSKRTSVKATEGDYTLYTIYCRSLVT
ncbi:hypothetical protein HY988_02875 [Candidatus Micrarchaeota archaeon]|nr:hypothetical protein [Candidatus Micrarchaeota archaeon]